MSVKGYCPSRFGLDRCGVAGTGDVYWNLPPAELYEHALRRNEGSLSESGALVCSTGAHTGRSPQDKFFVEDGESRPHIDWGRVNVPISPDHFDRLHSRVIEHYREKDIYVRDMYAGAADDSRIAIRVITETAWHNLFASQLFIRPQPGTTAAHEPQFTILNAPTCLADPATDGTRSGTFVVLNLSKGLILIGGTAYAGEIKKSIFTLMNYLLPLRGVLSMHCSANVGEAGDVALFFGLSGTGKTTLSADPLRRLIGDDEHGWSDSGIFNVEGGCYAKCIQLSARKEPQIFKAIRFDSVLENVVTDPATREIDFDDASLTENTRAAYPVSHIDNAVIPGIGGHPKHVLFLTCDAFGVLPPIARLSRDQAMYHFISGYTAKVAGTEEGVTEPEATFSACFGAPFLPLPAQKYATMLGERLKKHDATCWLVNTGWSGGEYGVGERMSLPSTRAMIKAALAGKLENVSFREDSVFGLSMPESCPGVDAALLDPRVTWRDKAAYDKKARELAGRFARNFERFTDVPASIAAAGPRV